MTLLAIQMNEPEEGVCPTDSRNRPDQRFMEEGQWAKANMVKLMLEEKQRAARRKREEEAANNLSTVEAYSPVWFQLKKDPITQNPVHIFSGEYWKCKEKQDWSRCPDIYSYQDMENIKLKPQEDE
jgi:oxysterol-binding protein 1, putative